MKYLNKVFCKKCIKELLGRIWEGILIASHIDTRGVELVSGIIAITTGIFLSLPPNITGIQGPSEYWGWLYLLFGVSTSLASIFGKWPPRRYIALIGVFLWINLLIWLTTIGHGGPDRDDDLVIACIPYSFFLINSVWTYLGLWRYTVEWRYFHDTNRNT